MSKFSRSLPALSSVYSQLSQSCLSLIATVAFAHVLSPTAFGILAVFWLSWMLWLSMNRSVFSEQLLASSVSDDVRNGYRSFVLLWLGAGTLASVTAASFFQIWELLAGVSYIALFVGSDAARYYVMSAPPHRQKGLSRPIGMIIFDSLRLMLAFAALLAALADWHSALPSALLNVSAGLWILPLATGPFGSIWNATAHYLQSRGNFERALSAQFILGTGVSQTAPILATIPFGIAALGTLRLTQSLLSPITLLTTALQPTVIRALAARKGKKKVRQTLLVLILTASLMGAILAASALFVLYSFGEHFVPVDQVDAVKDIAIPVSVMLAVAVIGQPGGALIRVRRMAGPSLKGQLIGSLVTIALCLVAMQLTFQHFVWALAIGSIVTVGTTYLLMALEFSACRRRP